LTVEEKKAGFEVVEFNLPGFFADGENKSSAYDATMFGWSLTAIVQGNSTAIYKSDGGNNYWGWVNASVDSNAKSLDGDYLTDKQIAAKRLAIDKVVISNYWGLPLYQNPTITAYTKALKNVKPGLIGAVTIWNYWEWHY
jgi:peptide/nickel transport system substrate-binding protein